MSHRKALSQCPRIAQRDVTSSEPASECVSLMRKKKIVPNKETDMNSIADSAVTIQTSSQCMPSTPRWLGEVALLVPHLRKQGVLSAICERVRFARRRFGHYEGAT